MESKLCVDVFLSSFRVLLNLLLQSDMYRSENIAHESFAVHNQC